MKIATVVGLVSTLALSAVSAQAATDKFVHTACVRSNDDRTVILPSAKFASAQAEIGIVYSRMNGEVISKANNYFGKGAGGEWQRPIRKFELGHKKNTCFTFHVIAKGAGPDAGAEWQAQQISVEDDVTESRLADGTLVFTRSVIAAIDTPDGMQSFLLQFQTIAAGSGVVGKIKKGAKSFEPSTPKPDRKPSANEGALYNVDENDFLLPISNEEPPLFCIYSQPDYQGNEKCFRKRQFTMKQGSFFGAVRSMRIAEGAEVTFIQPQAESNCEDGEECLEAATESHPFTIRKPTPKTRFNVSGFAVRVQ